MSGVGNNMATGTGTNVSAGTHQQQSYDSIGRYYAQISVDGRLSVWEVATGSIKFQFTPQQHLHNSPVSLVWYNPSPKKTTRRKSKGKQDLEEEVSAIVAIGTKQGKIMVVDVHAGEVTVELSGHKSPVTALIFNSTTSAQPSSLLSCSEDKSIIEWNIATKDITRTWKGDTQALYSLYRQGELLYSAGRSIKRWEYASNELIHKYSGHENQVKQMCCSPNGKLLFTFAKEERYINVWTTEGQHSNSVAVLVMDSAAVWMDVATYEINDCCYVLAVNEDGLLNVWEVSLELSNRKRKLSKPLHPNSTISVKTPTTKTKKGASSPSSLCKIRSAVFSKRTQSNDLKEVLFMASMTTLKPQFVYQSCVDEDGEWKETIVCEDVIVSLNEDVKLMSKDQQAVYSNSKAKMLGSLDMAVPSVMTNSDTVPSNEVTLSEQLGLSAINDSQSNSNLNNSSPASADSLGKLLVQALHSNDNQLLEDVLSNTNDNVMMNTVKRLPTTYVIPFLTHLINKFQAKPNRGLELVPWIRSVMLVHTSYLMTVPDLLESLGGLYQLVDARLSVFKRLLKLNGRLDLLLSQITVRSQMDEIDGLQTPVDIQYEQDTDDEDDSDSDVDMMDYRRENDSDDSDEEDDDDNSGGEDGYENGMNDSDDSDDDEDSDSD